MIPDLDPESQLKKIINVNVHVQECYLEMFEPTEPGWLFTTSGPFPVPSLVKIDIQKLEATLKIRQ